MKELIRITIAIGVIILVFSMMGCFTITIHIDQGKSVISAPVEYEEEVSPVIGTPVKHKRFI